LFLFPFLIYPVTCSLFCYSNPGSLPSSMYIIIDAWGMVTVPKVRWSSWA
jgi:hypothetical protein